MINQNVKYYISQKYLIKIKNIFFFWIKENGYREINCGDEGILFEDF